MQPKYVVYRTKCAWNTYNYKRSAERCVCEEVTGLREARRLALKAAAILVAEVRVHKDSELRLRDQERRERTP